MQPDWYYQISVGIVQFPDGQAKRFQAYKALQAGYGISLKDIVSSGGFNSPYYVDSFVLKCNDLNSWDEIDVQVTMEDRWDWFDLGTMDIHMRMLKQLESVGCKMIYLNVLSESKSSLVDRIPKEYMEHFVCNIEWFKMLTD